MENNLQLVGYRINKFDFKFHDKYKQTTQFKILPKIECRAGRNEKTLFVNLSVRINEDISSPVPFNIDVEMFGTCKRGDGMSLPIFKSVGCIYHRKL